MTVNGRDKSTFSSVSLCPQKGHKTWQYFDLLLLLLIFIAPTNEYFHHPSLRACLSVCLSACVSLPSTVTVSVTSHSLTSTQSDVGDSHWVCEYRAPFSTFWNQLSKFDNKKLIHISNFFFVVVFFFFCFFSFFFQVKIIKRPRNGDTKAHRRSPLNSFH